MQNTFRPWLTLEKLNRPVAVFCDTDPAHVSWDVMYFCMINQIILLSSLPPHRLHPMNSFVLPHLKNAWTAELLEWNSANENRQFTNDLVASTIRKVFEETITVELLKAAFHKSGMFPFDPIAAYISQQTFNPVPEHTIEPASQLTSLHSVQQTTQPPQSTPSPVLQATDPKQLFRIQFEELIGPLLYEFKNSRSVWTGAIENTSLFDVWQRLRM